MTSLQLWFIASETLLKNSPCLFLSLTIKDRLLAIKVMSFKMTISNNQSFGCDYGRSVCGKVKKQSWFICVLHINRTSEFQCSDNWRISWFSTFLWTQWSQTALYCLIINNFDPPQCSSAAKSWKVSMKRIEISRNTLFSCRVVQSRNSVNLI